jgi:hypothetical protein
VRIFKNKAFTRFAKKADVGDAVLCDAIQDAARGLIAADLGGGVIKQRIARPGQGKSGGFRALIVFRAGARAFFVHDFAKNEKDNVGGTNWPPSKSSHPNCSPMMIRRLHEWSALEH